MIFLSFKQPGKSGDLKDLKDKESFEHRPLLNQSLLQTQILIIEITKCNR